MEEKGQTAVNARLLSGGERADCGQCQSVKWRREDKLRSMRVCSVEERVQTAVSASLFSGGESTDCVQCLSVKWRREYRLRSVPVC